LIRVRDDVGEIEQTACIDGARTQDARRNE
jgi:hypothetical protein